MPQIALGRVCGGYRVWSQCPPSHGAQGQETTSYTRNLFDLLFLGKIMTLHSFVAGDIVRPRSTLSSVLLYALLTLFIAH